MSEDRRKKKWIMHEPKHDQQLSRITKKKKKKVLAEHWLIHRDKGKMSTEINRCKGCERGSEQIMNKCEWWIRCDHNIKVMPESLIERNNNKINAMLEQLLENRTIEEYKKEERKLVELRQIEDLEIELIRKQKLDNIITNLLTEILIRNKEKDKDIFYTDGALYKEKEENDTGKIGIGWVQVGKGNDWPEEEIALGLEGWP